MTYQEIIATRSLDPRVTDELIAKWRIRSQDLMERRAEQIGFGLVRHLTSAMEEDMASKGEL